MKPIIIIIIGAMVRFSLVKENPDKVFYSCYKNFNNQKYKKKKKKRVYLISDFKSVNHVWKCTLNHFASLKQKSLKNNNQPVVEL